MLKRILTPLVLVAMLLQTSTVQATDLNAAFKTLVGDSGMGTASGPGSYSTDSRNVFVAGGVEVRYPRGKTTVSLLSITPPTMPTAGCGGISAHFGGFSFVSGDQIEKLIKNIGQNAVGMVVSVVIKTLCPICDAVIQAMTKLAADAAKLSIDSCAVATNLVHSVIGSGGQDAGITSSCGKNVTQSGGESDWLKAMNGIDAVCSNLSSAMQKVGGAIRRAEGKDEKGNPIGPGASNVKPIDKETAEENRTHNRYGNTTWNLLNEAFGKIGDFNSEAGKEELRNRMLLMNVLGTTIYKEADETSTTYRPVTNKNATISPKQLFDLFMCGAPTSYTAEGGAAAGSTVNTRNTRSYCRQFYGSAAEKGGDNGGYGWYVFQCPARGAKGEVDNYETCETIETVELKNSSMLRGAGFLSQTEGVLLDAVDAVKNNKPGGFDKKFLDLIRSVNFPVYQAINAAAIYPASTGDLMTTMSVLVAESLVYAKLEQMVAPQGTNPNDVKIKRELAQRVYDVLEAMNKMHLSQRESYGRMMTVQEGAVQSIRQINLAIQKQVMTPELLGNAKFSAAQVNAMSEKPTP